MQASDLRHMIKFQSVTTASDSMGGRTATDFVTEKKLFAKIESNGADVELINGQKVGTKNWLIRCRFQKDYTITKKVRILWGTRVLTPNVPVNVDNLEKWMTFEAYEKI